MDDTSTNAHLDELLFEYVGLKAQVRALQHEMEAIYPDVLEAMKSLSDSREVGGAVVSVQLRNIYKYSDQVSRITDELKARKKQEVDTGIAEIESVKETVFVRFKKAESQT